MSDGPFWQFVEISTTLILASTYIMHEISTYNPCTFPAGKFPAAQCFNFSLSPRIFEMETFFDATSRASLQNTAPLPVQSLPKLDEIQNK